MTRRLRRALLVWPALVLAACSAPGTEVRVPGHAVPAASGEPAAATRLPFGGAPKVARPLPVSVLSGDPCADAFTPEQIRAIIGIEVAGDRGDLPLIGPTCRWPNLGSGGAVGVAFVVNTHVGLSGVYANTKPQSAVWRVLPDVQGFPAVAHADAEPSGVPVGFCQASIGLADTFSLDLSITLGNSKQKTVDACSLLPRVGDMALSTLRAKAGV